jgi:hypothetical protein
MICKLPACNEPATGKPGKIGQFCSPKHYKNQYYLDNQERLSRQKKDNYHAKSKDEKREAHYSLPSVRRHTGVVAPDETKLVYVDYKEPLAKVREGFGYVGTIATNEEHTHIQCHLCGLLFKSLSGHVKTHELTTRQYKEKFGLALTSSLASESQRKVHMGTYQKLWSEERKDQVRKMAHNIKRRPGSKRGGTTWSAERRNKAGNCSEQVLQHIRDLAKELGHTPSITEFQHKHHHNYMGSIRYHHGTWTNAVKKAGYTPVNESNTYDRLGVLAQINEFREREGREPLWSDFIAYKSLPHPTSIYNMFGGLREARKLADGLKLQEGG